MLNMYLVSKVFWKSIYGIEEMFKKGIYVIVLLRVILKFCFFQILQGVLERMVCLFYEVYIIVFFVYRLMEQVGVLF